MKYIDCHLMIRVVKNKAGRGMGCEVQRTVISKRLRDCFTEKVIFEQRPEGGKGQSHTQEAGGIAGRRGVLG